MRSRGLFLLMFLLTMVSPIWGQFSVYDDPYAIPIAQQPEWQQAVCDFETMPSAFHSEYNIPFAAQDLDELDATYSAPFRKPPVIGGDDTPPDTPGFKSPVGDVPIGWMLLLSALYMVVVHWHCRKMQNK